MRDEVNALVIDLVGLTINAGSAAALGKDQGAEGVGVRLWCGGPISLAMAEVMGQEGHPLRWLRGCGGPEGSTVRPEEGVHIGTALLQNPCRVANTPAAGAIFEQGSTRAKVLRRALGVDTRAG